MKRLILSLLALLLACAWASAESLLPYTVSLTKGTAIHSGPGIDYAFVQALDSDGVFTIVEEGCGLEEELWGRLKSGAGWVQLSEILPRTISLSAGAAIHTGPGFDRSIAQRLNEDGVFTIVEYAQDSDGNPWGKLKSGAGWVILRLRNAEAHAPIFAEYASDVLLNSSIDHRLIAEDSEYAVHIAFIANETLQNVAFTALDFAGDDFEVAELLYTIDELHADTPFVASVAFPGDLTTYGLSFTDASGTPRRYTIYISGKDGSLVLSESK